MISSLHTWLAWVAIAANGAVGIWAVGAHWVEPLRVRALWIAVAIAQILIFVQVGLGVARLSQLEGDPPEAHTLYGFLCLIAVAILYGYRTQVPHLRYLLYGGGSLFVMGLAIRAVFLDAMPVI